MLAGPKPQLSVVKNATDSKAKHLNLNSPEPQGEIKKPAFVKGGALRVWKKYAPDLEKAGVLKSWDCDLFGAWCCLMAEFQKDPKAFITAKLTQMRLLGEAFGLMGPSSRERIKIDGKAKRDNPAAEFFN